jgi:glycosyltransferase involved in cell wall biosynthesis
MTVAGGIERITAIQANYWVNQGNEVFLITHYFPNETSFYELDERVKNIFIGEKPYNSIRPFELHKVITVFNVRKKQYRDAIDKVNPDIVISTMHGLESYFLRVVVGNRPLVGINHVSLALRRGIYEKNFINKVRAKFMFWRLTNQLRKYDVVVSLSRTDEKNLVNMGCQSAFIPNSASLPIIQTHNVRDKTVIMVGRLDYLKGQDRLLQIWKELVDKYKEWKLMFVGDGPLKANVEGFIRENGLQDSVVIFPRTRNVQDYLLKASVFAFTSRSESFGMVLLEAFACGLPVITFDCENGPRDIIKDNVNGFLIPDGDTQNFALKLQLLMDNKDMRERFVQNGYKTLDDYSVEKVMSQWDSLLDKVCPM